MSEPTGQNSVYRFGLYELDRTTGELRKDGKLGQRVQGQPLEVLLQLLARPGNVVTREELRLALWPVDTFVDYDHSLNTAVNKLREALSDSADNPRFIQTIARKGYRFIATVEAAAAPAVRPADQERIPGAASEISSPASAAGEVRDFVLSDPHDLPAAPRGLVQILFSLIQVMYLAFYFISMARLRWVQPILAQSIEHPKWLFALLIVTALVGIPIRLFLLSAAIFGYRRLPVKFLRLFPFVMPLDELWALAPFLLVEQIGIGLALAATATLLYLPFSQRSLMLMGDVPPRPAATI